MTFLHWDRGARFLFLALLVWPIGASPAQAEWREKLFKTLLRHSKTTGVELSKGTVGAVGATAVAGAVSAYQGVPGEKQATVEMKPLPIEGESWQRVTTAHYCAVPATAGQTVCKPCDMKIEKGGCVFRNEPPIEVECSAPLTCVLLREAAEQRQAAKTQLEHERRRQAMRAIRANGYRIQAENQQPARSSVNPTPSPTLCYQGGTPIDQSPSVKMAPVRQKTPKLVGEIAKNSKFEPAQNDDPLAAFLKN